MSTTFYLFEFKLLASIDAYEEGYTLYFLLSHFIIENKRLYSDIVTIKEKENKGIVVIEKK
jgi:hypothetical protein